MNDSDRDVLRTIIREELHAVLGELETARVRRSAALEELMLNEAHTHTLPADQMRMPTMLEEIQWLYPDPTAKHTIYEEVAGAPPGTFRVRVA